jgi:hypothetical protein
MINNLKILSVKNHCVFQDHTEANINGTSFLAAALFKRISNAYRSFIVSQVLSYIDKPISETGFKNYRQIFI